MGCASDLVRGEITDEAIRALACLIDSQPLLFSGIVSAGVLTTEFQRGISVIRGATGIYLVTLLEPVTAELNGSPITIGVAHNIVNNGPGSYMANAPGVLFPTTFTLRFFDVAAALVDPAWFSITVHKRA